MGEVPHVSSRAPNPINFPLVAAISPSKSAPDKLDTGTPIKNTPIASPVTACFCAATKVGTLAASRRYSSSACLHGVLAYVAPIETGAIEPGCCAHAANADNKSKLDANFFTFEVPLVFHLIAWASVDE